MSNFEDVETRYNFLLRKLDLLRSQGKKDSDLEVTKTKVALRDLLELKKKNSTAIQKVVPRLTGIKTVAFKPTIGVLDIKNDLLTNKKYVMLGVVLGIAALVYYYYFPRKTN